MHQHYLVQCWSPAGSRARYISRLEGQVHFQAQVIHLPTYQLWYSEYPLLGGFYSPSPRIPGDAGGVGLKHYFVQKKILFAFSTLV